MEDNKPTRPADGAPDAPSATGTEKGDGKPTVDELLSAARGDVARGPVSATGKTPV